MPEIPDPDFLRINRANPLVPPERVDAALDLQRREIARQGSCRSLYAILREDGAIDEEVARLLRDLSEGRLPAARSDLPGEVTPHTPTLLLSPGPQETPAPGDRKGSSGDFSKVRAARRPPPEVEEARKVPRNTLGQFVLVREVGRGGMGRVHLAWDDPMGRWVALKVIDADDGEGRDRFIREAQIAGRLHHPSIATVFQAGEEESRGWIAMPYIEGKPIDGVKRPLLATLALVRDAARALAFAHEQGVVHRDVKPGNLMVDGNGRVFLTDFGLAKEKVSGAGTQLSITGTTFGTPQFMSPEQARGEHKAIDGRSDVYSLGATLYALVAGRPPFTGQNVGALLLEVTEKKPPPLSRLNPEISPELQLIVERAMAKEPGRRHPTMAAFVEALDRLIREGRYHGKYGLARVLAGRWMPVAAAGVVLALAVRWGLPAWTERTKPLPSDESAGLFAAAGVSLGAVETTARSPSERRNKVEQEVLRRADRILERDAGNARARALRVRALYVAGDAPGAAKELKLFEKERGEHYRLAFTAACLAAEEALREEPPLPAIESPVSAWESPPRTWPLGVVEDLRAVSAAKVDPALDEERRRDAPLARGLIDLAEGRFVEAEELLREARQKSVLPLVARAWARAAYFARRFAEVAKSGPPGSRERLGARLALACDDRDGLLEVAEEAGSDAWVAGTARLALARRETGTDPEAHVAAGLAAFVGSDGASAERRAALLSARLRWRSLSGRDDEKEWREALSMVGKEPVSGWGRLAAVELRIGLGARVLRSKGDGRPILEEALKRAGELAGASTGAVPRVLRAWARLKLGQPEEARAEAEGVPGARARLAAAEASLLLAERLRRAGKRWEAAAESARQEALLALVAVPEHPEGLALAGGAAVLLSQAEGAGADGAAVLAGAEEQLGQALGRVPEYAEAAFRRGRVRFLRGARAGGETAEGKSAWAGALADLGTALEATPEHGGARHLRGVVNFSLGNWGPAVADWRALVQSDPSWDTPEVRGWIDQAEERLKRGKP